MFEDWRCRLQEMAVEGLDRAELCDVLGEVSQLRAAVDAFEARAAAAIDSLEDRGAPASTALRSAGRLSQREADRRAKRATTLAQLPAAADALAAGRLTAEHVETLGRAVDATSVEAVASSGLVESSGRRPADLAAKDIREWIRREQTESEVEAQQRRRRAARRLSIWTNKDGMVVVHGEFDPEAGAVLRTAIEAETNRLFNADGGRARSGDVRTPEQRRADALVGLLSDGGGDGAPVRFQIPVVVTLDGDEVSAHYVESGEAVPPSVLARLAARADFFGIVFSADGEPLWVGRGVRLATEAQWRALIARDGGCVVCAASPSQCEAHHVVPWDQLGPTDIDNLVLVCRHHHHLVHDNGWRLRRAAAGWELAPP